jgi:biotin carboxyl carrier protein
MKKMAVTIDDLTFEVELEPDPQCRSVIEINVNGEKLHVLLPNLNGTLEGIDWAVVNGHPYEIVVDQELRCLKEPHESHPIKIRELKTQRQSSLRASGVVKAPIPGQIGQILVAEGQPVETGQTLLLLEAMKMQNEIHAQRSGTVSAVHVAPGDIISRGDILVEIK